jgi:hypothetical protein
MMLNNIDNSTYLPTIFKQLFSTIMEVLKSLMDVNITDKSLKKCSRCKEMKNREDEFHRGASMCITCRKEYDMERNSGGNKQLIMSMRKAILELGEQVEKLTQRVEELERNNVAETVHVEDQNSDDSEEEIGEQILDTKISKVEPVENGPAEESSEEDESEPVKKPKKVKSHKSDEKHKAKKGHGKKPKKVEISETSEEETEPEPVKKPKKNKVRSDEKTQKKQTRK